MALVPMLLSAMLAAAFFLLCQDPYICSLLFLNVLTPGTHGANSLIYFFWALLGLRCRSGFSLLAASRATLQLQYSASHRVGFPCFGA